MARVFISYARTDAEVAGRVQGWLVDAGHEVFLDRDVDGGIRVGEDWQERLHERLRWADAVVCLVSAASVESTWCVCEVSTALSRGSRVLPAAGRARGAASAADPAAARATSTVMTADARARLGRRSCAWWMPAVDRVGRMTGPRFRVCVPSTPTSIGCSSAATARWTQLTALLRSPAERVDAGVLLVVGPSGCGKSSLVRAGLLPAMAAEPGWWTLAPMKPGADPVAALARELTAALRVSGGTSELRAGAGLAEIDDGLAAVADELLLAAPGPRRTRLLVVIDQFEELLTQTPGGRAGAVRRSCWRRAVRDRCRWWRRCGRSSWDPLLLCPELAELELGKRPSRCGRWRREALPAVIEEPARLAGIAIDDGLVARLVADTGGGEALPLLAYTLEQLAEGVGRGGRLLTSRYEQLGGVQGTLTRQADAALAEAMAVGGRSRMSWSRDLLRLVTVDEQGHPTRWRLPRVGAVRAGVGRVGAVRRPAGC